MTSIDPAWRDDYDWIECFDAIRMVIRAHPTSGQPATTVFTISDVVHIEAMSEGERDEKDWILLGSLRDGRWFLLVGWCCYTGWDAAGGAAATVACNLVELLQFGITRQERENLDV